MKLKSYLSEIGMTARAFSELLQIDYRYLCNIMSGRQTPGMRLARDIEQLTDGNVKFDSSKYQKVA
jgi:predicted transcriptional regulator